MFIVGYNVSVTVWALLDHRLLSLNIFVFFPLFFYFYFVRKVQKIINKKIFKKESHCLTPHTD